MPSFADHPSVAYGPDDFEQNLFTNEPTGTSTNYSHKQEVSDVEEKPYPSSFHFEPDLVNVGGRNYSDGDEAGGSNNENPPTVYEEESGEK